jgi:hypothetical protein
MLTAGSTGGLWCSPTALAATERLAIDSPIARERSHQLRIASANNFNPDLTLQPQQPTPTPTVLSTIDLSPAPVTASTPPTVDLSNKPATSVTNPKPVAVLEGLQPDVRSNWNSSGQVNQTIEQTAIFRLGNGDRATVKTGYDTYVQPDTKTATNIPVQVGWETKINSLKVKPTVGVDTPVWAIAILDDRSQHYPIFIATIGQLQ